MSKKPKDMDDLDAEIKRLMRSKSAATSIVLPTKSLLDIVMDKKIKATKDSEEDRKGLLHRMTIISKMCHNNFDEIVNYYDKFFKDKQAFLNSESVTGLLLLYPKHCVHVIESSNEMILEVVQDLYKDEQQGEGHMEKSKILISSHDIPNRLYQQWSHCVLDIEAPRMDEYDTSESAERLTVEMLTQLLKLGMYLSKHTKVGLQNLHEQVPELLPQQTVIGYLLESENQISDCIMTVEEFMQVYSTPYDVTLNSELTWPMPIRLFPYN